MKDKLVRMSLFVLKNLCEWQTRFMRKKDDEENYGKILYVKYWKKK